MTVKLDHNNKTMYKQEHYTASKSTGAPIMDHQLPCHTMYSDNKLNFFNDGKNSDCVFLNYLCSEHTITVHFKRDGI